MAKISEHIYQQIETAINHQNIIAIENGDDFMYFTCPDIETSSTSNVGSVDFNQFRGVNITDYLQRNKITEGTPPAHFLNNFMDYIKSKQILNIKLNKNINYILFCR